MCCAASRWIEAMIQARPFADIEQVHARAVVIWNRMQAADFMEAFEGHPRIGDPESLRQKYRHTRALAAGEQAAVEQASDDVLAELAELNQQYQNRFGYIFIVCATGKTALQMLELIRKRINNAPDDEIKIAAAEQQKITAIRIKGMLA